MTGTTTITLAEMLEAEAAAVSATAEPPAEAVRLTDAQAEVLGSLLRDYRDSGAETLEIDPYQVYPAHDNHDSAKRRTLRALCEAGLLERDREFTIYRLSAVAAHQAQRTYAEWYDQRGYRVLGRVLGEAETWAEVAR